MGKSNHRISRNFNLTFILVNVKIFPLTKRYTVTQFYRVLNWNRGEIPLRTRRRDFVRPFNMPLLLREGEQSETDSPQFTQISRKTRRTLSVQMCHE